MRSDNPESAKENIPSRVPSLLLSAISCALLILCLALWTTKRHTEARLSALADQLHQAQATAQTALFTAETQKAARNVLLADVKALQQKMSEITATPHQAEITALQARLKQLDTVVTDISVQQSQPRPAGPIPSPAANPSSSAGEELVLLKERNRLTLQADEAMATAEATPLRSLWHTLRDPAFAHLRHAAAAEIIRVQNHLDHLTRLPPGYRIPVHEHFPGAASPEDSSFTESQLTALLKNEKNTVQVRARAARLLSGKKTLTTGEALLAAMRTDAALDVVKEAQISLHSTFEFSVPLFDMQAVDAWWQRNRSRFTTPENPAKP